MRGRFHHLVQEVEFVEGVAGGDLADSGELIVRETDGHEEADGLAVRVQIGAYGDEVQGIADPVQIVRLDLCPLPAPFPHEVKGGGRFDDDALTLRINRFLQEAVDFGNGEDFLRTHRLQEVVEGEGVEEGATGFER